MSAFFYMTAHVYANDELVGKALISDLIWTDYLNECRSVYKKYYKWANRISNDKSRQNKHYEYYKELYCLVSLINRHIESGLLLETVKPSVFNKLLEEVENDYRKKYSC